MTPDYNQILTVLDSEMQNLPKGDAIQLEMEVMYRVDELGEGVSSPDLVTELLSLCRPFPSLLEEVQDWLQQLQTSWTFNVAL